MFDSLNKAVVKTFGNDNIGTYNADDIAEAIQVKVIFDKNTLMVDPQTDSIIQSYDPMVHIVNSDLPRNPKQEDRITMNGVDYKVVEVHEDSEGMSKLQLHKVLNG